MKLSFEKKIKIALLGMLTSLLITLMVYALFSREIADFAVGVLENNIILVIIILGLLSISLLISFFVSIIVTENLKILKVLKASLVSFAITFALLIAVSYLYFFIFHFELMVSIPPIYIPFIFGNLIVYFSIFAFNNQISIILYAILVYYIIFIILLSRFYEYTPKKSLTYREFEQSTSKIKW